MNYYLLFYHVGDDYVTRRAPYRDEHLRLVKEAYERGELIMAGALANPVDQAILVFHVPKLPSRNSSVTILMSGTDL